MDCNSQVQTLYFKGHTATKNNRNEALEVDSGLVTVVLGLGGVQKIRIFGDTPFYEKE